MRRRLGGLCAPELLESRIAPVTFIVTSLADDNTDGTLRKEIADANAAAGADTIVFDKALAPGTITLNTATGEIPITEPLTIKGPGIDKVTVTGSDMIRIFNINYAVASLVPTVISGLSLIDGKAAGDGAAILSVNALTLKNVVVASSEASGHGGGVQVNTLGKVLIDSSRIVNNKAVAAGGGGGLYLVSQAGISVVKSTIADNTAPSAGGLYAHISGGPAPIIIDKVIVTGNSATGGDGGGISLNGQDDGKIFARTASSAATPPRARVVGSTSTTAISF